MTEIKTATAWGPKVKRSGLVSVTPMRARPKGTLVPVVIVHGQTEAEVHEAAALLAKSREVCEWELVENAHAFRPLDDVYYDGDHADVQLTQPNYCPSCGRKVVVK